MKEKTILIVDDNKINSRLLEHILSDYTTIVVYCGEAALAVARARPSPDLILLDIMMPDMDGHEVCRQLKQDPETADIPIIFVTSRVEAEDESAGLALGAVDYLHKPVNADIVLARVKTHLTLSMRQHDLERLIAQRTVELESALAAAESANRAKSEFLSTMSHEIRTPMHAIIGMTEQVLQTSLTEDQRMNLDIVQESAQNLLGLINDILDFSKMEARQLTLESIPFDLRGQLEEKCAAMAILAHKKGLELYLDIAPDLPSALIGDPLRLKQILLNLVNNAIKFTEVGEVVVQVKRLAEMPEDGANVGLHCAVSDTGIGIPADAMASVFKRFTQVDSSITRQYGGTGLGLAICQQLVERMGGRLGVESQAGRGSTFYFTASFQRGQRLPSEPDAGWEERKGGYPKTHLAGVRVLLGDRHATGRQLMKAWLVRFGARVEEAVDASALQTVCQRAFQNNSAFDLMVLDYDLIRLHGTSSDRSDLFSGGMVKGIVMVPSDLQSEELIAVQQRFSQTVRKPVRLYSLLKVIDRLLGRITETDAPKGVVSQPVHPPVVPKSRRESTHPPKPIVMKPGADPERFEQTRRSLLDEWPDHVRLLHLALNQRRVDAVLKEVRWIKTIGDGLGVSRIKIWAMRLKGVAEIQDWEEMGQVCSALEEVVQETIQAVSAGESHA